ncbi:FAD/NAD(P)-binding protein [Segnochrobactraceae bacterium EtOH-i3]
MPSFNPPFDPAYPPAWPRTAPDQLDVAILGAGQTGVALWHGLRRAGIDNIALFDAAAPGAEGVWRTTARMRVLRTDKDITGPELGEDALSFRRWLTERSGADAFDALDRIPRLLWQDYLDWFRAAVGARPVWHHRLVAVAPAAAGLTLTFASPEGRRTVTARHLLVATGMDGFGAPWIPDTLRRMVPAARLSHTADAIPFADLAGARVLVVGAAAGAFDAAATALEHGAAEVIQISRQPDLLPDLPRGALRHLVTERRFFHRLSDATRWATILHARRRGVPPEAARARLAGLAGHQLHFGHGIDTVEATGDGIAVRINGTLRPVDHVIAGTGYRQGARLRPEFAPLAPLIRTWGGRGLPTPAGAEHWGDLPYLGAGFELLPAAEADAWVSRIHILTFAAILSHGVHVGDIASARLAVPRLVDHVAGRLFETARATHEAEARAKIGPAPARQEQAA